MQCVSTSQLLLALLSLGLFWWQTVKRLPTMQETWVLSLGQEDPLKKEMETHSSILAWEIPGMGAWWAIVHSIAKESDMI